MEMTPELLEKLRTIGLRIDRSGRMWHQGDEVTHPRLKKALLGWLDVRDDGRDVVRLDDQRYAYVEIDDAHLRATSARWDGDRVWLLLDDGAEEELAYDTLREGDGGALYARVRGGKLRARLSTAAHDKVAERIVAVDGDDARSGFALDAAGKRWPIDA